MTEGKLGMFLVWFPQQVFSVMLNSSQSIMERTDNSLELNLMHWEKFSLFANTKLLLVIFY